MMVQFSAAGCMRMRKATLRSVRSNRSLLYPSVPVPVTGSSSLVATADTQLEYLVTEAIMIEVRRGRSPGGCVAVRQNETKRIRTNTIENGVKRVEQIFASNGLRYDPSLGSGCRLSVQTCRRFARFTGSSLDN